LIGQGEYLFPEGYKPSQAMKELYANVLENAEAMKNPKWAIKMVGDLGHPDNGVEVSNMDSGQMSWSGHDLATLIAKLPKSHQSVLFVICDKVFASKTQERIQSLVGSLNRVPDYASGGTIKADVYTIVSPEDGEYKIYHGLLTNYENIEANGTISIPDVLEPAKQRWTMAAFAV
jgi:hypothetical protein